MIWLATGFFIMLIGDILIRQGLPLAASGKKGKGSVIGRLSVLLFVRVLPGCLLAWSGSVQGNASFVMTMLAAACYPGLAFAGGILGIVTPYPAEKTVWKREVIFLILPAAYLVFRGAGCIGNREEIIALTAADGIVFTGMAVLEGILLMGSSMRGYVSSKKRQNGGNAVLRLIIASFGVCLSAVGAVWFAGTIPSVCEQTGFHPVLLGASVGAAAAWIFYVSGALIGNTKNRYGILPALFGGASLLFCAGTAVSCFGGAAFVGQAEIVLCGLGLALLLIWGIFCAVRKRISIPAGILLTILSAAVFFMAYRYFLTGNV